MKPRIQSSGVEVHSKLIDIGGRKTVILRRDDKRVFRLDESTGGKRTKLEPPGFSDRRERELRDFHNDRDRAVDAHVRYRADQRRVDGGVNMKTLSGQGASRGIDGRDQLGIDFRRRERQGHFLLRTGGEAHVDVQRRADVALDQNRRALKRKLQQRGWNRAAFDATGDPIKTEVDHSISRDDIVGGKIAVKATRFIAVDECIDLEGKLDRFGQILTCDADGRGLKLGLARG